MQYADTIPTKITFGPGMDLDDLKKELVKDTATFPFKTKKIASAELTLWFMNDKTLEELTDPGMTLEDLVNRYNEPTLKNPIIIKVAAGMVTLCTCIFFV